MVLARWRRSAPRERPTSSLSENCPCPLRRTKRLSRPVSISSRPLDPPERRRALERDPLREPEAREPRPLGCRVYFCDPTYQETGNAITETHLRLLKELAEEFDLDWRYAPLHVFLNEVDPLNIEHRTSNIEHRSKEGTSDSGSMFDVRRIIPLPMTSA